jgi:hypothetical protein
MESTTVPAAGWFPDPGGSTSERWWSGDAWTEHTRQPLGDAVPAAFAAHVDTLVQEPVEEQDSSFTFAMTSTEPGTVAPTRPPVPAALLEAQHASAAPVMTVPVVDPAPSVALPVPPEPAPVATAALTATASAAPAFAPPGFVSPSSPASTAVHEAPAPTAVFTTPAFAEPVVPAPAAAEADGFVMPNLAASFTAPADAPSAPGRHADAPAYVPEPPKPEVRPAAAPVGFTSSADPEIANRYRQVIHAPEQTTGAAELGAPLAPLPAGSPAQPGWGGMPLPSAAGAPGYAPAPPGYGAGASGYAAVPPGYAPVPLGYAPTPNYPAPTGSNKAAKLALSSGISSLAALAFIFFGRILIVPSILSLVAIIAGIVGLVLARRAGVGKWSALGGLLMGIATSATLTVSLVVTVLGAFELDTSVVEDDIVANAAPLYGVDIVSANCPDDVSLLTSTTFSCTAFDSSGGAYAVEVEITSDGYMEWDLKI